MPEWSNGVVSKTIVRVSVPRVRIPVSPPFPRFFSIIVTDNFFTEDFLDSLECGPHTQTATVHIPTLAYG